ncbi:hypothetical protein A3A66_03935 [Microgenomates group bacterium RIFCSPLOWO2_01_FULL_46_13]|nr:MAG: hypothetical protein A2783_03335 [Microgenomates group bacterium RIFCSPHIGHO2_01_FULL_45_11]OGV94939.1 MAG: hypothetical protein A3A66_03935 [Microgenomates group bacterium RIFCSPLOWO2_01_FULL_46_13]
MAAKLFVGGLSWGTTDDTLKDFFAQAGTVVSATVITDKFSGRSKGFGFVEMSTDAEADTAIEKLNGQTLDNRSITVNKARPQVPRENRFGDRPHQGGGYQSKGGFRGNR